MLLAKNSQNMNQDIFRFVPIQILNKKWSDKELYTKYQINEYEIDFIDSVIKIRN
jgi:site-specific DNA-methyltransferase (adenine-specific)